MRSLVFFFALFQSRVSASFFGQQCPSEEYDDMKIFWIDYTSFYVRQEANGTLSGIFPRIMKKALHKCCPRLNYSFAKLDYESTVQHEAEAIHTIHKANRTICALFPILAAVNDFSAQTLFQFIPIKVSPGPMVLASKKSLEDEMDPMYLVILWQNPVFYLILALAVSAGVIFWVLVGIYNCTRKVFTEITERCTDCVYNCS